MPNSSQDSPPGNKIRSAIDLLLSSDSVKVSDHDIEITKCDPLVDVVMNRQGGICTKCNTLFESRVFLLNHIKNCHDREDNGHEDINNGHEDINNDHDTINTIRPKLMIVSN